MSYAQSGIIQSFDYNNLVGSDIPSTTSNKINTVWGTGTNDAGYGQTELTTVATSATVTASQWSTLIGTLNTILQHQNATYSNVALPTVGETVTYLATVNSGVVTAYTNRRTAAFNGLITTGAPYAFTLAQTNQATAATGTWTRTVSFESAEKARYFFNCGGKINFVTISASNNDSTARSADLVVLVQTNLASVGNIASRTNSGRSGTGGTVNTNATTLGYFTATTTAQNICDISTTNSSYLGDYIRLSIATDGSNLEGNNDNGEVLTFKGTLYSAVRTTGVGPAPTVPTPPGTPGAIPGPGSGTNYYNQSINVTWNYRIDIVYPETTYLPTNSWGTVTIA
jgi:hypothetical protein